MGPGLELRTAGCFRQGFAAWLLLLQAGDERLRATLPWHRAGAVVQAVSGQVIAWEQVIRLDLCRCYRGWPLVPVEG